MKYRAFTLIELLVVIVIIGILSTITTATFKNFTEKARMAKAWAFERQILMELRGEINTPTFGIWNTDTDDAFVRDFSVNGNHLSYYGTVTKVEDDPYGTTKQSIDLDGNGTVSQINLSGHLHNNQEEINAETNNSLALSTWIKILDQPTGTHEVMFIQSDGNLTRLEIQTKVEGAMHNGSPINFQPRFLPRSGSTGSFFTYLEKDKWHHVLLQTKPTQIQLFINGELIDEINDPLYESLNTVDVSNFILGRAMLGSNIRIYNPAIFKTFFEFD